MSDHTGKLPGGLYVVATPIGNLGDITARAISTLKAADVVACEDTRVTGQLLRHLGVRSALLRYDDHVGAQARPQIVAALSEGKAVALVSDAGTPLISDPGYKLVDEVLEAGYRVIPIPGPSAIITALSAAGLPTDRFYFGGFLPVKDQARRTALSQVQSLDATLVFYESPKRLADCLSAAADVFGGRQAVVGRELTKLYEEFVRGDLSDLATRYRDGEITKGEAVLMIAPPSADARDPMAELDHSLSQALETLSVKDAASFVATALNLPKKTVYQRALALKNG